MSDPLRLRFTVPQFKAYVVQLPKPGWGARCLAIHHTFVPNQNTWHGQKSVDGMVAYWRSLGWTHWVHLTIALEGGVPYVYVINSLLERGTGVRGRNSDTLEIEHVWNGDASPFDARLVAASREVQTAVGDWAGIPAQRSDPNPATPAKGLFYHRWRRDAYKTCPGSKVKDADLIGRPIQPTPPPEVDMLPEEVDHLKRVRLTTMADSFDEEIVNLRLGAIMAKLEIPDPPRVVEVLALRDKAVRDERKRLKLDQP